MTATQRRGAWGLVVLVGFLAFFLPAPAPPAHIVIEARGMVLHLKGEETALRPGQRVVLTFANRDKGMVHDLSLEDLGIGTGPLSYGETAVLRFRVPPGLARLNYLCGSHSNLMRGALKVDASG